LQVSKLRPDLETQFPLELSQKQFTNYLTLADEEDEDETEGVTVINVVHAHNLQETQLTKKDFMALVKPFLKRTTEWLKEHGKEDRVAGFQSGATEMVKFIVGKFDEMQIFTGPSFDTEASLAFAYTKDGETDPTFMFFHDAMKLEKF
jgi:hypothetical protein